MNDTRQPGNVVLISGLLLICLPGLVAWQAELPAAEPGEAAESATASWQDKAVQYAQIMSHVQWTPVADGMPKQRRGDFEKGTQYTGVPYSNQTYRGRKIGRSIGFEIFLKTFLAAVENPESVLYTVKVPVSNEDSKPYYGLVCSSFTSYALQCGFQFVARQQAPHYGKGAGPQRGGVVRVDPQSAQAAAVGDVIYTPPSGQHVEIVTEITRDQQGLVTHVRVEDSTPPTTRNRNRSAADFETHISARGRGLYRITDLDAWREDNRAESFRFPNYAQDSADPVINRVLLLDHGDWVPYFQGQEVKINVMDRDSRGVESLVIQRGDAVVEEIELSGPEIIERTFTTCGDYTAHCVMSDGSLSQACEFAVCGLDFRLSTTEVTSDEPWEITFESCHMRVIYVRLTSSANAYGRYHVLVSDEDRENGKVTVPAGLLQPEDTGVIQVSLFGENSYGRLHRRKRINVVE